MRSEILQELHADYERQRELNAQEEARRQSEVAAVCPEILAVREERLRLVLDGMRGALNGSAQDGDLPKRMDVMNRRIAQLLREHGFAEDYLNPIYRCPVCKDRGYVGEPIREPCECLKSRFFTRLYEEIGLREDDGQSFEHFNPELFSAQPLPGKTFSQRDLMRAIRADCESWANQAPKALIPNLLLSGKSGLGKTFLMHAMTKRLLSRGLNALLLSAYQFFDIARNAYFGRNADALEDVLRADALLIDDLGCEPLMENITIIQWYNLLNERASRGLATAISTNLTLAEIKQRYTERIASRLSDVSAWRLLQFFGEDIRRRAR